MAGPTQAQFGSLLRKAADILKKKKPSDLPAPKEQPQRIPTDTATKTKTRRRPGKGVLTFKDAVEAVDSILLRGIFDFGLPENATAQDVAEAILATFAGGDNELEADRIYEKMRQKILPQTNPKVQVEGTFRRRQGF